MQQNFHISSAAVLSAPKDLYPILETFFVYFVPLFTKFSYFRLTTIFSKFSLMYPFQIPVQTIFMTITKTESEQSNPSPDRGVQITERTRNAYRQSIATPAQRRQQHESATARMRLSAIEGGCNKANKHQSPMYHLMIPRRCSNFSPRHNYSKTILDAMIQISFSSRMYKFMLSNKTNFSPTSEHNNTTKYNSKTHVLDHGVTRKTHRRCSFCQSHVKIHKSVERKVILSINHKIAEGIFSTSMNSTLTSEK